MNSIPRHEHPNPQFERQTWQNLNGLWKFDFDFGKSGLDRQWQKEHTFTRQITVPYPPESKLSGIEYTDFMPAVWYQRNFEIGADQLQSEIILHFGAVDYKTEIFVNGQSIGAHEGGYDSFSFEIREHVHVGINTLTVYVEDDVRSGRQPKGKQSSFYYSRGCDYTRTTGIWQTVWLEFVPFTRLESIRYYPNIHNSTIAIEAFATGKGQLSVEITYAGRCVGQHRTTLNKHGFVQIELDELHLWEIGDGALYDVTFSFEDDTVHSYFGMREIELDGYEFKLNGKTIFQRFVLLQGFYEDGVYTAKDDESLKHDITLSQSMGFNGARLHEKAFEPRFYYHCDRAGFMVWAEMANWGIDLSNYRSITDFLPEWQQLVKRDFNHPSIITWSPFNETWNVEGRPQRNEIIELIYRTTKDMDPTRPCVDTSGNYHVVTDFYDVHDYTQDVDQLRYHFQGIHHPNGAFWDEHDARQTYKSGQAFCISEYGGIKWDPSGESSWGYGTEPQSKTEFLERYEGLTNVLLQHPQLFGYCYTQLYDIEQEKNGLCYYNRKPKFDTERIKAINLQPAAIELLSMHDGKE